MATKPPISPDPRILFTKMEVPRAYSMLDAALEGARKGIRHGSPSALGQTAGYEFYKRITGTQPLENAIQLLETATTRGPINTRTPMPEYKRGGLVKRKK